MSRIETASTTVPMPPFDLLLQPDPAAGDTDTPDRYGPLRAILATVHGVSLGVDVEPLPLVRFGAKRPG